MREAINPSVMGFVLVVAVQGATWGCLTGEFGAGEGTELSQELGQRGTGWGHSRRRWGGKPGEIPWLASKSAKLCCISSPARFGGRQSILQRCEGGRHGDICQ